MNLQEPVREQLVDVGDGDAVAWLRVRAGGVRPHVPDLPLRAHLQDLVRRRGQVREGSDWDFWHGSCTDLSMIN